MPPPRNGFSLVEALIASLLMATAVVGLAHLVVTAAAQGATIRSQTTAIAAAQSKLDQLRSLAWTYAADGTALSDQALGESPSGSVDYLDSTGASCGDDDACSFATYVRRWSITLFDPDDLDTLALQICVFRINMSQPDACVSAIRTRHR